MRGGIRAGSFVRSGPSGAPPPYGRAFEVGSVAPVSALVRYAGALYYDRVTGKGWLCTGSTSADWMDIGQIVLDSAKVARLAEEGWLGDFAKLAAIYAPGAAECREFHAQSFPTDANATATPIQGGGLTYANRQIVRPMPVLIANPKTEPWAVAFDMETALPVSGKMCWFGIMAADPSANNIGIWNNADNDPTRAFLRIYNGASDADSYGWTVTTGRHTIVIAFDLTTVRMIVDGAVKASTTTLTRVLTAPAGPFCYADDGWLKLSRIAAATVY